MRAEQRSKYDERNRRLLTPWKIRHMSKKYFPTVPTTKLLVFIAENVSKLEKVRETTPLQVIENFVYFGNVFCLKLLISCEKDTFLLSISRLERWREPTIAYGKRFSL